MITETRFSPLEAEPGLIYLGNAAEKYKQVVYASQIYGTFFMVYGTFSTSAGSTKDHRKIDEVIFELVNYKGLINIGIKDVTFNTGKNCFHLHLEALSGTAEKTCKNIEIDCTKHLYFIRELSKISNAANKGIHDDEFYYRDGIYSAPRIPHHKLEIGDADDIIKCIEGEKLNESAEKASFAPGARCMMSELKVLI